MGGSLLYKEDRQILRVRYQPIVGTVERALLTMRWSKEDRHVIGSKARIGKPKIAVIQGQQAVRFEISIKVEDGALKPFKRNELRTIVGAQSGQLAALQDSQTQDQIIFDVSRSARNTPLNEADARIANPSSRRAQRPFADVDARNVSLWKRFAQRTDFGPGRATERQHVQVGAIAQSRRDVRKQMRIAIFSRPSAELKDSLGSMPLQVKHLAIACI